MLPLFCAEYSTKERTRKGCQNSPFCGIVCVVGKNTLHDCFQLAKKKGGTFLSKEYKTAHTLYKWKCNLCKSVWEASYHNVRRKTWCPKCSRNQKRVKCSEIVAIAKERGGECLNVEKYRSNKNKLLWRCKKGHEWTSRYNNIQQGQWCPDCANRTKKEKLISFFLKNHGVDNPSKVPLIASKIAKARSNSCVIKHWRTNDELVCTGSWEQKVVMWLNYNKIDFDWQIHFNMPSGKVYIIDLYLKNRDVYVEIKGRWFPEGRKKWDWFRENYLNSELWDKKALKEKGIL